MQNSKNESATPLHSHKSGGGFTHLHVHSHYSLLDGLPKIDQLLDRAKELGMNSIALTDHGNMYGAIEFYKKAKEKGMQAIIGVEMYMAYESMQQERPGIDDKIYHLILLAKNQEGYQNLTKLLTKAHVEGFYYKPRIDEELLAQHSAGLIGLSACLAGKISRLIVANKLTEAQNAALRYQEILGKGNFYLELQRHAHIPEQEKVTQALIQISKATGIPVVATGDSHYLNPEDAQAQDILMLINTGAKSDDPERLTMKADDFSLQSLEQMQELYKDVPEAITNTQLVANACNLELELGKARLPSFPLPQNKTADQYLRELCEAGLAKRPELAQLPQAKERMNFELGVISSMGFASYFLIVQDFVNWAKGKRIVVGPGRGSVGGSLVAYLLRITNIDPIKYNLLFERFLNPGRAAGLPDIDLDFADYRRDEVIAYVAQKYGQDKVAQIITFGTMAARAVIRDVGRALGYEYSYCDRLAKLVPFGKNLEQTLQEVQEFQELYETDEKATILIDLAKKLEGVARHASKHACGVVIAPDSLDSLVPVQHPSQSDQSIVTQYEMHSIEDMGLLKMDFLGLKNLSVIEDTLKRIYVISHKNIDIENIPLNDPKVFKLLQDANTVGVFQVESSGMQRYLRELKPTEFEDIIAMIALYRPGPMELIPEYIARKHKRRVITYIHPKLQPILESTQGICIYQEQLMRIAQDLAGFSLADADVLRKAVGKKIMSLLVEQQKKFVQGMMQNNIEQKVANQLWEWILPFARYGFNRSHSTAYAIIAYQTAWLKVTYPVEFMSALLTAERNDIERIAFLIDETRKMGIPVLPPDINESFSFFSVVPDKQQIRFGLSAIKNVGEGVVDIIIQERKDNGVFSSMQDFITRVNTKALNKKSLESMIKAGVFDQFDERNKLLHNVERFLDAARAQQKLADSSQRGLFEGFSSTPSPVTLESTQPVQESERLSWEKELLGLYVSSHPLDSVKNIMAQKVFAISKVSTMNQSRVRIGGIISTVKKIITKTGKPMLFMVLEDLTDKIEVVVFPKLLEQNPVVFQENKIVFIGGRLDNRNGERKFIAEDIEELITT